MKQNENITEISWENKQKKLRDYAFDKNLLLVDQIVLGNECYQWALPDECREMTGLEGYVNIGRKSQKVERKEGFQKY